MKLKPSLREKKRYLAYEIISKGQTGAIGKRLEKALKAKMGMFEDAGIIHVKYDQNTQRGIIRMGHKYVNKVKVALMLMNAPELGLDEDMAIHTMLVSGSLKKLEHFAS